MFGKENRKLSFGSNRFSIEDTSWAVPGNFNHQRKARKGLSLLIHR
jgi:hypothetical protein